MGTRMEQPTPKQFLPLGQHLVIHHSLKVFASLPAVREIVVVCDPLYRPLLAPFSVQCASPGPRRQDSLYNGLLLSTMPWICVHDAARPFITKELVEALFSAGFEVGAATLGIPVRSTLKTCSNDFVSNTLDREGMWEAQTPQLIARSLLEAGCARAAAHHLTLTDDVAFAELLGHPVKMVRSTARNFKLTVPEDYDCAQAWCEI